MNGAMLETHQVLIRNQSIEELKRKADKAIRLKSNMWTQEELDYAKAKAKKIREIIKWEQHPNSP